MKVFLNLLLLTLVVGSFTSCRKSTKKISKIVVAKIGPHELKSQEFADQLALRLKNFDALTAKNSKNVERVKEVILNRFLIRSLTEIWTKENGLTVSQESLNAEISRIRSQYPNDLAFRRNLAKEHISFDNWKNDIHFSLLQKLLFKELRKNWKAPDEKALRNYYDENKAEFKKTAQIKVRQIVTEREDKAKLFLKKLRRGKKFKDLVQYSSGPEKSNGGLTDWIDVNTLDVFKKAYRLPIGSRSSILKSPFGFHIIEVVKKRSAGHFSFDAVKEKIRQQILEHDEQELYSSWLDSQIRRHGVFKNDKVIASISVFTEEN